MEIGVNSFKIEGRMKSVYYLATILSVYRKVIDGILDGTYKYEAVLLDLAFNLLLAAIFSTNFAGFSTYIFGFSIPSPPTTIPADVA